jgi:5'-methylthioadenosine phosphorylase
MSDWFLGVIGGSGLYEIDGLVGDWQKIDTPFGLPSDDIFVGEIDGQKIAFLPRHGRGHKYTPSTINYRANIYALKSIGVTDILSVSAVGSLKQEYAPGDFVFVDQFIDRTFAREKSFFGNGLVAHVSMAHPICERLSNFAYNCAQKSNVKCHKGGIYMVMEGPQFSSKAESELYRTWGCDVIGMTNMPEAKLAREAQIPYATMAMITDYDCWNEAHDNVDVASVIKVLHENSTHAKTTIKNLALKLKQIARTPSPIDKALENAIITAPNARDPQMVEKLRILWE